MRGKGNVGHISVQSAMFCANCGMPGSPRSLVALGPQYWICEDCAHNCPECGRIALVGDATCPGCCGKECVNCGTSSDLTVLDHGYAYCDDCRHVCSTCGASIPLGTLCTCSLHAIGELEKATPEFADKQDSAVIIRSVETRPTPPSVTPPERPACTLSVPDPLRILARRAKTAFEEHRFTALESAASSILELNPEDQRATEQLRQAEAAIAHAKEALPDDLDNLRMRDVQEALSVLEAALHICADLPTALELREKCVNVVKLRSRTRDAIMAEDWDRAESMAEEQLEAAPLDPISKELANEVRDARQRHFRRLRTRRRSVLCLSTCAVAIVILLILWRHRDADRLSQAKAAYAALQALDSDGKSSIKSRINAYSLYLNQFRETGWMASDASGKLQALHLAQTDLDRQTSPARSDAPAAARLMPTDPVPSLNDGDSTRILDLETQRLTAIDLWFGLKGRVDTMQVPRLLAVAARTGDAKATAWIITLPSSGTSLWTNPQDIGSTEVLAAACFPKIEARSKKGDPEAKLLLFWIYRHGLGTEANPAQAKRMLQDAANDRYPPALYVMAVESYSGGLVQKSASQALAYAQQAAIAGCARAYYISGLVYYGGLVDSADFNKAVSCFSKGAEAGDPQAMSGLAHLYFAGQGVGRDLVRHAQLLRLAADAGMPEASTALGMCYADGLGVEKDMEKAYHCMLGPLKRGDPNAAYFVGTYLWQGGTGSEDFAQAVTLWRFAADHGIPEAFGNIGTAYALGRGVSQDFALAKTFLERGAMAGGTEAMYNLANLYHNGLGVQQDFGVASRLYTEAARRGNVHAQDALRKLGVTW